MAQRQPELLKESRRVSDQELVDLIRNYNLFVSYNENIYIYEK
jgi:hypothetical protein